jgi:hypothetical protein
MTDTWLLRATLFTTAQAPAKNAVPSMPELCIIRIRVTIRAITLNAPDFGVRLQNPRGPGEAFYTKNHCEV